MSTSKRSKRSRHTNRLRRSKRSRHTNRLRRSKRSRHTNRLRRSKRSRRSNRKNNYFLSGGASKNTPVVEAKIGPDPDQEDPVPDVTSACLLPDHPFTLKYSLYRRQSEDENIFIDVNNAENKFDILEYKNKMYEIKCNPDLDANFKQKVHLSIIDGLGFINHTHINLHLFIAFAVIQGENMPFMIMSIIYTPQLQRSIIDEKDYKLIINELGDKRHNAQYHIGIHRTWQNYNWRMINNKPLFPNHSIEFHKQAIIYMREMYNKQQIDYLVITPMTEMTSIFKTYLIEKNINELNEDLCYKILKDMETPFEWYTDKTLSKLYEKYVNVNEEVSRYFIGWFSNVYILSSIICIKCNDLLEN